MEHNREEEKEGGSDSALVWKALAGAAALATVVGLMINILLNFSDMRASVRDVQAEMKVLTAQISAVDSREREMDKSFDMRINAIDQNGSRNLIGTEAKVQELRKEMDNLKDSIDKLNQSLISHNNEMVELYHSNRPIVTPPTRLEHRH